jgi:meso-butanediol dehydrogenase / (S,S)-butanediol dehydrogenase / diacetyl reductase
MKGGAVNVESGGPGTIDLGGRVALVTGAGQGIGRAIALQLAHAGADVAVNDLAPEAAEAVAAEVRALGRRALAVAADVSQVAQIDAMVGRTVAELGALDVLVNNAGLIRASTIGQVSEADWDLTMAVNARGVFFCMQAAARVMMARGRGTIISLASIAGRGAPTLSPPYAASKAVVISLTQQLSRMLAPHGITVNAVCPGIVNTAFNWRLDEEIGVRQRGLAPGEFLRQRAATIPLGRLAEPDDIARVVAFLASPAAGYITGQSITVDGGVLPG